MVTVCVYCMDMASTTHHKENAMNTTDNTNLCCEIHEPEIVTITMTLDQLHLLTTICDVARDDDDEDRPDLIDFADALWEETTDAIIYYNTHTA